MFSLMENMPQHEFIPFCVDFDQNLETPYRKYFVSPPAGSGSVYYGEFKMSSAQKVAYAVNSIYSRDARRKLENLIRSEMPEIAMFLNAVYFSDSIIDACRTHNIPIVWRMSDLHKVCASYLLYRDGHVCEDCLNHGLTMAIRNRCGGYQRSIGAALIKVAGMWLSRLRRLYKHVNYFIAPSAFTREIMIRGGFFPEKVIHMPTWISIPKTNSNSVQNSSEILYVGRISYEKGIETLLEAFKILEYKNASLSIVGDDTTAYAQQLKAGLSKEQCKRTTFHGFQGQDKISELFRRSACFVVPSACYENQPNVVLEGMALGRPAIVSDLGSLGEMVVHGRTGLRFEAGNARDLANCIAELLGNPQEAYDMGTRAKEYVAVNHSMEGHLSSLQALFEKCTLSL